MVVQADGMASETGPGSANEDLRDLGGMFVCSALLDLTYHLLDESGCQDLRMDKEQLNCSLSARVMTRHRGNARTTANGQCTLRPQAREPVKLKGMLCLKPLGPLDP